MSLVPAHGTLLRRLIHDVTRRLVLRRHLPKAFGGGVLYVSPSASLRYMVRPMTRIDPMLLGFVDEYVKPGSVVWDVGANVGFLTFASAFRAGPSGSVVAFEADTWLVGLLRRSSEAQSGGAPVTVLPVAVADSFGVRTFCIAKEARAANHLGGYGRVKFTGGTNNVFVMAVTLDMMLDQVRAPDVLKIDVEGAEIEVLRGAERVFNEHKPVVLCEVAKQNTDEITAFFASRGYTLLDAETHNNVARTTFNTIALPPSRFSHIDSP